LIGRQLKAGFERGDARIGKGFGVLGEILGLMFSLVARSGEGAAGEGRKAEGGDGGGRWRRRGSTSSWLAPNSFAHPPLNYSVAFRSGQVTSSSYRARVG
jgi:hypothetical protein